MYLFAVLQWSVNAHLNTCYPEVKHILKIRQMKLFKQNIKYFRV